MSKCLGKRSEVHANAVPAKQILREWVGPSIGLGWTPRISWRLGSRCLGVRGWRTRCRKKPQGGPADCSHPLVRSRQVLEPSFRQAFPNTNRWFLTCINQPQFRAVLGEVKLCEKMAQFDGESEEVAAGAPLGGFAVSAPGLPVRRWARSPECGASPVLADVPGTLSSSRTHWAP